MATKTVGLSTHIWNNNIKCIMLLMLYPVLLLCMLWAIAWALGMTVFNSSTDYLRTTEYLNNKYIYDTAGVAGGHAEIVPAFDPMASVGFANVIAVDFAPMMLTGVAIWFTIAWFFNTSMIRKLAKSHPVTRAEEPELYNLLENLCISQGMPMPHLEIIETHARNAFASGITQNNFAVTVTRGLMNSLAKDELEGVLAHELAHIQNRDVRLLIVTVIFTGLFGFLSQLVWSNVRYNLFFVGGRRNRNGGGVIIAIIIIGLILWLGYLASLVMRFALSRRREYMADAGAIEMTKNPDAMMRALMRISGRDRIPETTDDIAMMCIENHVPFLGVFKTHPPIEKRIKAISTVTATPIPDSASLPPVQKSERITQEPPRDEQGRINPWLIRGRR